MFLLRMAMACSVGSAGFLDRRREKKGKLTKRLDRDQPQELRKAESGYDQRAADQREGKYKSAFLSVAAFDLVFSGEASRFSWGLEIVLRAVTHSEARLRGCKKSFWRLGGEKKT